MRTIGTTILLIFLLNAGSFAQHKNKPCSCPLDSIRADRESVLAILYQQRSAEYTALCLQAYNIAKRKVEDALANPVLLKQDMPLAVITDLDETALDNSANEVRQYLKDSAYDPNEFNRWVATEQAGAVPGSLAFFNYVDSLSKAGPKRIDIYYISNRDVSAVGHTQNNMKNLGFPQWQDSTHFLFKKGSNGSKEGRRQQVLQDHQIIVLLGDNLIDLDAHFDGYQQTAADRMQQVYNLRDKWGSLYVVFPNADYGDWESYFYYDYRLQHKGKPHVNMNYIEENRKGLMKGPEKPF